MTVSNIRFRAEGEFVVLQVLATEPSASSGFYANDPNEWRDAKVTDLLEVGHFTRSHPVDPYRIIGGRQVAEGSFVNHPGG